MFRIDTLEIDPAVVLAPMEGVTDRAFRALIRHLGGVGLTVTEFVSSEGLTRDVESAWKMAELDPREHPVSIQIYGRDPERMAQAAAHCEALGADMVDINLGCPSKRVTSGCAGSALMKEPEVAYAMFRNVRKAISVPMTVKMRLGWDDSALNATEIARVAQEEGAAMVSVHARTRQDAYKRPARWHLVQPVREVLSIPLLINGDIVDAESAREAMRVTQADGVMIGRAARQDPWTIARVSAALAGKDFQEPTLADRRSALDFYIDYLANEGAFDRGTVNRFRGVVHACTRGLPHGASLREGIQRQLDFEGLRTLTHAYLEAIADEAPHRFRQHLAAGA